MKGIMLWTRHLKGNEYRKFSESFLGKHGEDGSLCEERDLLELAIDYAVIKKHFRSNDFQRELQVGYVMMNYILEILQYRKIVRRVDLEKNAIGPRNYECLITEEEWKNNKHAGDALYET